MAANVRSYKLNMAPEVYGALKQIADDDNISIADVMRRGIKWVLLEEELDDTGGSIYIKKGADEETIRVVNI